MGIKYAKKYAPKYYNPNWSQYDPSRMAWEKQNGKYGINNSSQKKTNTSPSSQNATHK